MAAQIGSKLYFQAGNLPERDRNSDEVEERLRNIRSRYKELLEQAALRKTSLMDARLVFASQAVCFILWMYFKIRHPSSVQCTNQDSPIENVPCYIFRKSYSPF